MVDPSLLGGVVAQVGDTVIDGSVRTRLEQLKNAPRGHDEERNDGRADHQHRRHRRPCAASLAPTSSPSSRRPRSGTSPRSATASPPSPACRAWPTTSWSSSRAAVGLALNLDEHAIGAVVLGDAAEVREGQVVKATGRILSVPVGDGLLGRVVNALGKPVDGGRPLTNVAERRMEIQAPGIMGRQPVHEPLQTGIKAIDAMTPVGRGQRELIIGDRKTGKTTIAIDTILNQRGLGVKCIYVAIGQKESTVENTVETLRPSTAPSTTRSSWWPVRPTRRRSSTSPPTPAAPWASTGWRTASTPWSSTTTCPSRPRPTARSPCCCAARRAARPTPGDVFYLHSRLLERAAKLSDENGGGSLTALPVIETKAGDISAYIPTNVISITDGQIFLQDDLFKSGVRPAFDTGQSVSRVGGAAQIKAMKKAVGTLKGDLSQFRELESFAAFGSELDKVSQAQLDRGYRLVELLKQPLNSPMPVEEQVVSLYAATNGYLDATPVDRGAPLRGRAARLVPHPPRRHPRRHPDHRRHPRRRGLRGGDRRLRRPVLVGAGRRRPTRPRRRRRRRPAAEVGDPARRPGCPRPTARRTGAMPGGKERELRRRIRSVQSTKKITKAMELIAASRIVKAQQRVAPPAPTARSMTEVIRNLAAAGAGGDSPCWPSAQVRTVAYVVIAADRGLCGAYNGNVIRAAERSMLAQRAEGRQTAARHGGQEGHGLLPVPRLTRSTAASRASPTSPSYEDARQIADIVVGRFESGEYDLVELAYTQFLSAASQRVVVRRFVPLDPRCSERRPPTGRRPTTSSSPNPQEILDRLLPRYAEARLYAALLDGAASFLAAQQRAMKSATDNAEELIVQVQPGHEPGPPGRHHHRDHGDRRRGRGPAVGPVDGGDLLIDHALWSADILIDSLAARTSQRPLTRSPRMTVTDPTTGAEAALKDGKVVAIAGPGRRRRVPPRRRARHQHRARVDHRGRRRTSPSGPRSPSRSASHRVRAICLKPTDGLVRGTAVRNRAGPDDAGGRRRARPRAQRDRRAARRAARRARRDDHWDIHRGPRTSTPSSPSARCSRPASRSSTCSPPTCRAARSACSAAPAWARRCSSRR